LRSLVIERGGDLGGGHSPTKAYHRQPTHRIGGDLNGFAQSGEASDGQIRDSRRQGLMARLGKNPSAATYAGGRSTVVRILASHQHRT
jgi:hypothetical protein